jgi:hypothetical protein
MPDSDMMDAVWQADKRAEIAERQNRAYGLLLIFQQRGGDDDQLTAIGDLIGDLLHLGDQYGMGDVDRFVERAVGHYNAERDEAGIED